MRTPFSTSTPSSTPIDNAQDSGRANRPATSTRGGEGDGCADDEGQEHHETGLHRLGDVRRAEPGHLLLDRAEQELPMPREDLDDAAGRRPARRR